MSVPDLAILLRLRWQIQRLQSSLANIEAINDATLEGHRSDPESLDFMASLFPGLVEPIFGAMRDLAETLSQLGRGDTTRAEP